MPSNSSHETSSSMKFGIIGAMSQFRSFSLDASRLLWLWWVEWYVCANSPDVVAALLGDYQ
ncbi:hypothetical protein M5D96_000277, partial [Drosophila gunungcola]